MGTLLNLLVLLPRWSSKPQVVCFADGGPFDEFPIWGTSHPLSSPSRDIMAYIMTASPNSTIESTVTIPIFITNGQPVTVFRSLLTRIRRFEKNMSHLWSLPLWPRTSFEFNEERVLTFKMRRQFLVRDVPHLRKNTLFLADFLLSKLASI